MRDDQEMLARLGELLAIESVAGVNCSEEAPYGTGPAAALDYVLGLCASLGFRTKNCDGQVGWAEIGEGSEMVGVLCHLDVVPAGEGWDHEPYALTLTENGRAYGRGVIDDKGPAMCCVYAMKDILDSGVSLKRRIRIIFGLSEETGSWEDMAYYVEHEEAPVFGITPDADFPAIYGEKGILTAELRMPLKNSGLLAASGGTAANVVPARCSVTYAGADGQPITVRAEGRPAHGSLPEDGVNAISAVMEKLAAVPELNSPFVDFYQTHIGWDYYGGKMGCGLEDGKSGRLTLNAGVLTVDGEDLLLKLNIREPVTFTTEEVMGPVRAAAAAWGMTAVLIEENPPIYMDRDGPVITALLEVYREMTGDLESQPAVIGGGTYARAMNGIVAFGPMLPGRELTEHMNNEYALVEDLYLCRAIYRRALEKLAGEL
ncbi:Sapep family Mn(2+)-dependent dipeptidase [uncultured Dysosmobacter sp.]|uniref:Sapep family Mn(2+)-dependent dipeptidase n=1 Tax=uncultured Dysosmobacter sp. TaxID=2591384 RepID=UPI0026155BFF|nr:Sapep family Mn(2+)-dependent dipeptidase [uncultured Dysosmobacter sp.]